MKKSFVIGLATTAVALSAAGILGTVSAATSSTSGQTNIIDKIATKFNLKKADVQAVFDQDHADREAAHAAEEKTELDAAVKAGTITQAQEDQIIAKQTEMRTFMDSLKDKTEAERRTAMQTKMDELKTWATTNNIPMNLLHAGGRGHGHGMGGPGDGMTPPPTSTSNQ